LAQFAGHTNESLAEGVQRSVSVRPRLYVAEMISEEAQLKKSIEVCRTAAASIPDALKANAHYAKAKAGNYRQIK